MSFAVKEMVREKKTHSHLYIFGSIRCLEITLLKDCLFNLTKTGLIAGVFICLNFSRIISLEQYLYYLSKVSIGEKYD